MSAELRRATAAQLRAGFGSGAFTSLEVVDTLLGAIAQEDAALGAWLYLRTGEVRGEAQRADDAYAAARASGLDAVRALAPLLGVPIALKDLVNAVGTPTTAGSKILEGWVPQYDATVVEKLRKAGLPILGKTNLDEFAMGSSNENSAFGPVLNPWNPACVAGGSSGGARWGG